MTDLLDVIDVAVVLALPIVSAAAFVLALRALYQCHTVARELRERDRDR